MAVGGDGDTGAAGHFGISLRCHADRLVLQEDLGAEAADWVGVATVFALLFDG